MIARKWRRRLAVMGCLPAFLVSASGCGILPGNEPTLAETLAQLTEAAGVDAVHGLSVYRTGNKLGVSIQVQTAQGPLSWGLYDDGKPSSGEYFPEFVGPPIPIDQFDLDALLAELDAYEGPEDCFLDLQVTTTPGGARASSMSCSPQSNYLPGTAKLDGVPVPDFFDTTKAADISALTALYAKVFADGELMTFTQSTSGPADGLVTAKAPPITQPDGGQCPAELSVTSAQSNQPLANPVSVTCSMDTYTLAGMIPFNLDDYDPAQIAAIWDELNTHGLNPDNMVALAARSMQPGSLIFDAVSRNPYAILGGTVTLTAR